MRVDHALPCIQPEPLGTRDRCEASACASAIMRFAICHPLGSSRLRSSSISSASLSSDISFFRVFLGRCFVCQYGVRGGLGVGKVNLSSQQQRPAMAALVY